MHASCEVLPFAGTEFAAFARAGVAAAADGGVAAGISAAGSSRRPPAQKQ